MSEFPELGQYTFTVERGKMREFVLAIGNANPVYSDKAAAESQGYKDVIAPPTFSTCIEFWGGPSFEKICGLMKINPLKVLHGEQEYEYFEEIYPGDEITANQRVAGVSTKEGKGGSTRFLVFETTYNKLGRTALISRLTLIERL